MKEVDIKVLDANEFPRAPFGDGFENHAQIMLHNEIALPTVARLAVGMLEHWSQVAAVPDGEDSSGRSKLRLQTPEELAQRACDAAAALWKQFDQRGWLIEVGDPQPKQKKNRTERATEES